MWKLADGSYKMARQFSSAHFSPNRFMAGRGQWVSCKQCVGCRLEYSRQWATRSVHEAHFHDDNWFLTLTFSDEFLPKNRSLDTRFQQNFWKRLRRHLPESVKFKYFCAGEYGDLKNRPHYHASVFGLPLPDLRPTFKSSDGFQLYSSARIDRAWSCPSTGVQFGNAYIAELSFETAAYTARYITKKVVGDKAAAHYAAMGNVMPERAWISKGLGKEWYEAYREETFRDGYVVVRGVPSGVPGTYVRWLQSDDSVTFERYKKSTEKSYEDELKIIEDLSSGRHIVAKAVKEAALRAGRLDVQR